MHFRVQIFNVQIAICVNWMHFNVFFLFKIHFQDLPTVVLETKILALANAFLLLLLFDLERKLTIFSLVKWFGVKDVGNMGWSLMADRISEVEIYMRIK